ncbi:hypothetical protein OY671_009173, partial [Metschnikowia pulcherrima]
SSMPSAALSPGVAGYAAASSSSAFYTNHSGRPQSSGAIAGLPSTLSFASGWWSVPRWGATGAGVASSVGYSGAIAVAYGVFSNHAGSPMRALWQRKGQA